MKRRLFLKGTLAGSAVAVAVGAGLLSPRQVLAAWPNTAYEAKSVQDALKNLFGSDLTDASNDIKIDAPEVAEVSDSVTITLTSSLKGTESITLIVEKNPSPLAASYTLGATAKPTVTSRVKMAQTSNIIAVIKAGGKLYSARKEVKVTIGGCGG